VAEIRYGQMQRAENQLEAAKEKLDPQAERTMLTGRGDEKTSPK
jgi:hypothetical protein